MRPAGRVARQILTALETMRSMVDLVPENARHSIDLTGLGTAFGADGTGHLHDSGQPRPGTGDAGRLPDDQPARLVDDA
jgi:hypothetical protein